MIIGPCGKRSVRPYRLVVTNHITMAARTPSAAGQVDRFNAGASVANRVYTADQVFAVVQAVENGMCQMTIAHDVGCSSPSVSKWKTLYRGFSLEEIQRAMEANIELEQLRREATRYEGERRAWKLLMRAIHLPLYRRIQLLGQLQSANLVSTHQAKRMLCIGNSMMDLVKYERDNTVVLRVMKEYLACNPSHGFKLMYHSILKGKLCGAKRAQKLYIEAGLQLYRRNSKRADRSKPRHLDIASHENATWSMDFMHFRLINNAAAHTLNVLDDFSRECLLIKGGFGTSSLLVAEQLNELVARRGVPAQIRCDNGPEFTGKALAAWASSKGIAIKHTAPFKFYQNGYIERFNLTMRSDLFRWNKFTSLEHFHQVAEDFRYEYNHIRPHQSLGWVTPAAFAAVNRLH